MKNYIRKAKLQNRLQNFQNSSDEYENNSQENIAALIKQMSDGKELDDQLTLAGFITLASQEEVEKSKKLLVGSFAAGGLLFSIFIQKGFIASAAIVFGFVYFAYFLFTFYLKMRKTETLRDAYFDTPLIIEEIILMIESGLALFPAIEKVCANGQSKFSKSIVRKYLKLVYQLTAGGIPMADAFAHVSAICPFSPIRSMLVHFDVSSSVGGELLSSLQALATQVHNEWKLSVETRVKKLENMVVFPVFTAVIGMMILTAAVPMVPILQFMDSIKQNPQSSATNQPRHTLGGK